MLDIQWIWLRTPVKQGIQAPVRTSPPKGDLPTEALKPIQKVAQDPEAPASTALMGTPE